MRYNKQKLLQMTSDELLAVAAEFGIADAQALDTQALVNTIVGAQADQASRSDGVRTHIAAEFPGFSFNHITDHGILFSFLQNVLTSLHADR